jgi:L-rhamnose mutarotase
MNMTVKKPQRYGSLIRVKPEFEERYIILHKYPFPDVLKRIRDSNLRNYSIFLREGMLFTFFEYVGDDYKRDMDLIAADATTRDWWKLTDPMQIPLETRKKGEWWASMPELLHFGAKREPSEAAVRFAYVAHVGISDTVVKAPETYEDLAVQNFSLFSKDQRTYVYLEYVGGRLENDRPVWESGLAHILTALSPQASSAEWHAMREVFHMD